MFALIQEPWVYRGKVRSLRVIGCELVYSRTSEIPRTFILVKKNFKILPLTNFCFRDLVAVAGDRDDVDGFNYWIGICTIR